MLSIGLPVTYQAHHRLDGAWHLEGKLDGCRAIIGAGLEGIAAHTRMGIPLPGADTLVACLGQRMDLSALVLDGELILEGRNCEQATRAAMLPGEGGGLVFYCFDMLTTSEWHTHQSPAFAARRARLEQLLPITQRTRLVPSLPTSSLTDRGMYDARDLYVGQGFEGVVAKQDSAAYPFRRSAAWLRFKPTSTIDGRVVGVNTGRHGMSSLDVDIEGGMRVRVGSGFTLTQRQDVAGWEAAIGHACELRFEGRTRHGGLRFCRYVQARPDKDGNLSIPAIRLRRRHLALVA